MSRSRRRLTIIIPYFEGQAYIETCLDAILQAGATKFSLDRIYLVDNSPQPFPSKLRDKFSKLEIIRSQVGIGFGRAVNLGIVNALTDESDLLLILNQDTKVACDCLDALVLPHIDEPDLLLTFPMQQAWESSGQLHPHFVSWTLRHTPQIVNDALLGQLQTYYSSQALSGACFCMSAKLVERYGMFDPLFYMYGEDDDLFGRFRRAGIKTLLCTQAFVAHFNTNFQQGRGTASKKWKFHSGYVLFLKQHPSPMRIVGLHLIRTARYLLCVLRGEGVFAIKQFRSDVKVFAMYLTGKLTDNSSLKQRVEAQIQKDRL